MSDIELVWLLLRLVAFAAGLLAGVLLVYALVWQPLARAQKEELDWQGEYRLNPARWLRLNRPGSPRRFG